MRVFSPSDSRELQFNMAKPFLTHTLMVGHTGITRAATASGTLPDIVGPDRQTRRLGPHRP